MALIYEQGKGVTQYFPIEPEHMHTRMTKRNCTICHGRMEQGERVNIAMQWEYPCTVERRDGSEVEAYRMKGRGAKVCRECAEGIAAMLGFDIPGEVAQ